MRYASSPPISSSKWGRPTRSGLARCAPCPIPGRTVPRLPSAPRDRSAALVQGDRALFEAFADNLRQLDSLRFYPRARRSRAAPAESSSPLVYRGTKGRRARILVGSPNPSRRRPPCLRDGTSRLHGSPTSRCRRLHAFLDGLDVGESRPLEALRFAPPRRQSEIAWTALSCAALDPVTRTLSLTWVDGRRRQETDVFYGSRRLKVEADSCVHAFVLDAAHGAVMTCPKSGVRVPTTPKGKIVPGYCPIDVALADRHALGAVEAEMSPEDWLALLGLGSWAQRRLLRGGIQPRDRTHVSN